MAAYAALCSLMTIIDQIRNHPRPPISLDNQQVQSLTEFVTSLQDFLEGHSSEGGYSKEADPLEARIADAAHAAEDVIESHIVDQIHAEAGSTSHGVQISPTNYMERLQKVRENLTFIKKEGVIRSHAVDQIGAGSTDHGIKISSVDLYEGLQKVIQDMDSIRKDVMEIIEKTGVRDQQRMNSKKTADSSRPSSTGQNTMVGFDGARLEILYKLTGGDCGRQVIPIVGMGGMGKTTLAINVYVNPLIQQYFDICAWATISQEYDAREILREILCPENNDELSDIEELGEELHKHLSGRRYLIVLDDMWSIQEWDGVRRFFPDNGNGSRIVITTRLSNLASQLSVSYCLDMEFLDEDKSWSLLCKTVFGEEVCPLELEEIGKKIAKNCKGLPLSIVVTGGLLAKSKHSREYWESIAENLSSVVNSEDNERCLKILYMSYKHIPVYLKPCFLYMGIFSKDNWIRPTTLIRLWVAEGFLKPISGKCLEEVGEEYLKELIDRNLVRASRRVGKIKEWSMHDLLRDLCLREAQKERFYNVMKEHSFDDSESINTHRCIVIPNKLEEEVVDELHSMSQTCSFIWEGGIRSQSILSTLVSLLYGRSKVDRENHFSLDNISRLVNSRYFAISEIWFSKFPISISLFWNLQMLTFDDQWPVIAPEEIWKIPQLRHVKCNGGLHLPDPPRNDDDIIVLSNLHSLSTIINFKCCEEVIQRIPYLKKLTISYDKVRGSSHYYLSHYYLNNLDRFHKLESFKCFSNRFPKEEGIDFLLQLSFPHSLKRLTLFARHVLWDDFMEKIGSLPLLEVLKLTHGSFLNCVWRTVEGQFRSLKSLTISYSNDLQYWNTESTHFPCLEQLVLENLLMLKEIPSDIGEIATLESIHLWNCSYSAVISARKILEEHEELGDLTLQVRVLHSNKEEMEALKSLATPNFQVRYFDDIGSEFWKFDSYALLPKLKKFARHKNSAWEDFENADSVEEEALFVQ